MANLVSTMSKSNGEPHSTALCRYENLPFFLAEECTVTAFLVSEDVDGKNEVNLLAAIKKLINHQIHYKSLAEIQHAFY